MVNAVRPASGATIAPKADGAEGAEAADVARSDVAARLIEHVEVTVEAILGDCAMKVSDLARLRPGEVLELDRQINEAVEIRVNGKLIGRGEIVTVDEYFAVRITQMG